MGLPQLTNRHLKDQAYRHIRDAITTLQFKPGAPVMEGKLAKSLGISKTPVRNALVRLEQEGFVQTIPFRGTFVSSLSVAQVREMFEVRDALEELAVQRLIDRATMDDVERLRRVIERGAHPSSDELEASIDSIREFHEELVSLSGNTMLVDMYAILANHIARIRNICGHIPGRVEKSAEEHAAIVDAIARAEPAAAQVAMRRHLDSLRADYLHATEVALSAT